MRRHNGVVEKTHPNRKAKAEEYMSSMAVLCYVHAKTPARIFCGMREELAAHHLDNISAEQRPTLSAARMNDNESHCTSGIKASVQLMDEFLVHAHRRKDRHFPADDII
ncbi:hypothetical protein RB195_016370 [Necator americanus]|uniref:Uncharacterized protein n=1 Tax=Necator americanus TaxID=51031 RepID=A0ABR1E8T9_NECAM